MTTGTYYRSVSSSQRVMQPLTYCLLLLLTVLFWTPAIAEEIDTVLGPAPGSYKILTDDGIVRIPFELFRGDIRMTGRMNGHEIRMLIDNGFLWDQLLFFGSPRVDSLGMVYDGEAEVGGGGDGEAVKSHTASGITISFPGVEFYDQTAIITPYNSGVSNMWWGAEGQVSATFLKHFVVDVNFDSMVMTLTEPDKFQYGGGGVEIPIKHLGQGAWAIPAELEMQDGRVIPIDLAMDLGDGNPLFLRPGGPHDLTIPDKSLPASLGFGIQGEIRGYYGRVRSATIGGYRIDNIVTAFVDPEYEGQTFHEATIGLTLMSRFNFIFDYPHHRMFIEPNHTFNDPFEYSMSGVAMRKGRGEYLQIDRVYPDSPASEAGLQVGDRVTVINGRAAVDYDVWELHPLMRQEGATVTMTVEREDMLTEVSLILRRIL